MNSFKCSMSVAWCSLSISVCERERIRLCSCGETERERAASHVINAPLPSHLLYRPPYGYFTLAAVRIISLRRELLSAGCTSLLWPQEGNEEPCLPQKLVHAGRYIQARWLTRVRYMYQWINANHYINNFEVITHWVAPMTLYIFIYQLLIIA